MIACKSKTTAPKLLSIEITPASIDGLIVNSTSQLDATGTYSDGTTGDVTYDVTWVSENTAIATIDWNGIVTGVAAGTTNIDATLNEITSPAVSLAVISLSSIAISPAFPANLVVGSSQQFTATATYSDDSTADVSSQVTWASDTIGIATIGYASGIATGVAPGTANIMAALLGITSPPVSLTVVVPSSTTTSP